MENTGKINNRDLVQITDFSQLLFPTYRGHNISPTDVDLCLEWQGRLCVIGELKWGDNDINVGQEITFTNVVNALNKGGYGNGAMVVVANHQNKPNDDIMAGDAIVRKVYRNGKWHSFQHKNISLTTFFELLLFQFGIMK